VSFTPARPRPRHTVPSLAGSPHAASTVTTLRVRRAASESAQLHSDHSAGSLRPWARRARPRPDPAPPPLTRTRTRRQRAAPLSDARPPWPILHRIGPSGSDLHPDSAAAVSPSDGPGPGVPAGSLPQRLHRAACTGQARADRHRLCRFLSMSRPLQCVASRG
jgi:hypothetical protein